MQRFLFLAVLIMLTLAACNSAQPDSPVGVVQSYVQARVTSDENKLLTLSCKDQESQAKRDADSFRSMKATLDSITCKQASEESPYTIVACEGKIVTEYAGETRDWNLADRNFKTIQEDGQWKVCGYEAP
jgi:hypothetical protein